MTSDKASSNDGVNSIVGDFLKYHEIKRCAMGVTTEIPKKPFKQRPEVCGSGTMRLKHRTLDDLD